METTLKYLKNISKNQEESFQFDDEGSFKIASNLVFVVVETKPTVKQKKKQNIMLITR